MTVTVIQIKAARAILNWTQEDLANQAGLSVPAINMLERGIHTPRADTLKAIQNAMEKAGVEFMEYSGVRLRPANFEQITYQGEHYIEKLDEDIFSVLQSPEDEMLAISPNEQLWMLYSTHINKKYAEHREKTGFKERMLIPENTYFLTSPWQVYRKLPLSYFGNVCFEIYGDRFASVIWDAKTVTITKNQQTADAQRKIFETLWTQGTPIKKSELKKYEHWDPSV